MRFVEFTSGSARYHVVADHVAYLMDYGVNTRIYFVGSGSDFIVVEGDARSVRMKMQGGEAIHV